eukprot:jgi/Mesvir1/22495/Mv18530-RA.1
MPPPSDISLCCIFFKTEGFPAALVCPLSILLFHVHPAAHRRLHEPFCAPEWATTLAPILAAAATCPANPPQTDIGTDQVQIVMTQDKGKTLVAARGFRAGEICLSELPLLRIVHRPDHKSSVGLPSHRYRAVLRSFLESPPATQRAVLQLYHPEPGSDAARCLADAGRMEGVAAKFAGSGVATNRGLDLPRAAPSSSGPLCPGFAGLEGIVADGAGGGGGDTRDSGGECWWDMDGDCGRGTNSEDSEEVGEGGSGGADGGDRDRRSFRPARQGIDGAGGVAGGGQALGAADANGRANGEAGGCATGDGDGIVRADADGGHLAKKCKGDGHGHGVTYGSRTCHNGTDGGADAATLLRVLQVYSVNGFSGGKDEEAQGFVAQDHGVSYLFNIASRFSHSCDPNCCRSIRAGDGRIFVRTLRDVGPGDELTISYINPEDLPLSSERRNGQLETFGFVCGCERCAGVDDTRGFACPTCGDGDVFFLGCKGELDAPLYTMSPCTACGRVAPVGAAARMEDDEGELCEELEQVHEDLDCGRVTGAGQLLELLRRCHVAGMRSHGALYQVHELLADKCRALGLFGLAACHVAACIRYIARVCRDQPVPLAFRVDRLADLCAGCIHPRLYPGRNVCAPSWGEEVSQLLGGVMPSGEAMLRMPFAACPKVEDVVLLLDYSKVLLAQAFVSPDSTYLVEACAKLEQLRKRTSCLAY